MADIDFTPFWLTLVNWGQTFAARLPYVISGLVVILVFVLIGRLVRRGITAAGKRSQMDASQLAMVGRIAAWLVVLLGILVAAVVIFPSFAPGDLVAALGITSIAVGFALKDILQNFFASILLLWQRPFRVGDLIRVKDFEGIVEGISIRSTQLRTHDSELAVLPNGDVYTSAVVVRTAFDHRRVPLKIAVKGQENLDRAREVIGRALGTVEGIRAAPAPELHIEGLSGSAVNLAVYIWASPDQATVIKATDAALAAIKRACDEAGIALA
jgi:small-conductance mechanosensitive channel